MTNLYTLCAGMGESSVYPPILASLTEARKFSCLLGHMPKDLAKGVHQMGRMIDPNDRKEPTFEAGEQPHVTVLYGLHTDSPDEVYNHLHRHRTLQPADFHLGDLDLFRHRDQDVLKVNVSSMDLDHLHDVTKKLPNSFSFPQYNPHVTVAYLKPGTGEKYLDMPNPLKGKSGTLNGLIFSTPQKRISYLPLRAPKVEDIIQLASTWNFPEVELVEMTTAMAVGTTQRPFGFSRPILPSTRLVKRPSRPVVDAQAKASDPSGTRSLQESSNAPDYIRCMDLVEARGWEHIAEEPRHSVFRMGESVVRIARHHSLSPIWILQSGSSRVVGATSQQLESALPHVNSTDSTHDDAQCC